MEATASNSRRGVDRLEAFSDGVFAIAITLLVLGIDVPDVAAGDLGSALSALWPNLGAYFLGFAVIALFWVGHHGFFSIVERHDDLLLWTNLAFLSLIALMPFTSALLGEYGDQANATALFAANVGGAALLNSVCELAAFRNGLVAAGPDDRREAGFRALVIPGVFLLSIPVAFASTTVAQLSWLLAPVVLRLLQRRASKRGY